MKPYIIRPYKTIVKRTVDRETGRIFGVIEVDDTKRGWVEPEDTKSKMPSSIVSFDEIRRTK